MRKYAHVRRIHVVVDLIVCHSSSKVIIADDLFVCWCGFFPRQVHKSSCELLFSIFYKFGGRMRSCVCVFLLLICFNVISACSIVGFLAQTTFELHCISSLYKWGPQCMLYFHSPPARNTVRRADWCVFLSFSGVGKADGEEVSYTDQGALQSL